MGDATLPINEAVKTLDFSDEALEPLFSPWVKSINGIMYSPLNFAGGFNEECTNLVSAQYDGMDLEPIAHGRSSYMVLSRVGGMLKFEPPLTHANAILILMDYENSRKLIILKAGGD